MVNIDRGAVGRTERLRSLDVESQQDFVRGFRDWMSATVDPEVTAHADDLLRDRGVASDGPMEVTDLRAAFDGDPLIASRMRMWITNQRQIWQGLSEHLNANRDHYLAEFEQTDAQGPGTLTLSPDLDVPDYCRHEIHIQPGGYVGDDLAGPMYHHGTNTFYRGQNDSDEFHLGLAARIARPLDGRVRRIVDLGCGIGQLTLALKETFPEAETWGVDISAPLLRYGHKRAVGLGIDVNLVQRLAEDTGLESGSTDLVTAYILFHEVSSQAAKAICAEAFRILRQGGAFDVSDFATGPQAKQLSPYMQYYRWADHHYNGERWAHDFIRSDFVATLESVGFTAELQQSKHPWMMPNYVARKPG